MLHKYMSKLYIYIFFIYKINKSEIKYLIVALNVLKE